jgi:hypothetical protein
MQDKWRVPVLCWLHWRVLCTKYVILSRRVLTSSVNRPRRWALSIRLRVVERVSGDCLTRCRSPYLPLLAGECPNDCSGHGVCKLLGEMPTAIPYPAGSWDAEKIQACYCDAGFFGPDCSQRK